MEKSITVYSVIVEQRASISSDYSNALGKDHPISTEKE